MIAERITAPLLSPCFSTPTLAESECYCVVYRFQVMLCKMILATAPNRITYTSHSHFVTFPPPAFYCLTFFHLHLLVPDTSPISIHFLLIGRGKWRFRLLAMHLSTLLTYQLETHLIPPSLCFYCFAFPFSLLLLCFSLLSGSFTFCPAPRVTHPQTRLRFFVS